MSTRIASFVIACLIVAGIGASGAGAGHKASPFLVGINDEAFTLYGDPPTAFATLTALHTQVLRVNLYWGGNTFAVANKKPAAAADPSDSAYNWSLYDRIDRYAANSGIKLLLSIVGTPSWANHGAGKNRAPTSFATLQAFAEAAAKRYSGTYIPPASQQDPSLAGPTDPLPAIKMWTAWNEPNNPVFLVPQYKKVNGKWIVYSAYNYARICNAVYAGIHSVSSEKVACGVTDPKGNDFAGSSRASVDPLSFLTAAHRYGMKRFDVYAHNPYANAGNESPGFVPTGKTKRRTQLGSIGQLLTLVTKYYGPKHLWITEYGYQTNPPDHTLMGVSWAKQSLYLKQAYAIARANPRIDMMLWFLVRDQPQISGWQSGLETVAGVHKPAWNAFAELSR